MKTSIAISGGDILFLKHSKNFRKCLIKIEDLYWQIITPPNMTAEAVLRLTTSLCWSYENYSGWYFLVGIMRSILLVLCRYYECPHAGSSAPGPRPPGLDSTLATAQCAMCYVLNARCTTQHNIKHHVLCSTKTVKMSSFYKKTT